MIDDESTVTEQPVADNAKKSWTSRHPKAMILLIAAVFYVILFGMCAVVVILLLRN